MSDYTLVPTRWAAVTPSDTATISPTIGLYIGGAGDVVAAGVDGLPATFTVPAGAYLTGRFTSVLAATSASGIVALYDR